MYKKIGHNAVETSHIDLIPTPSSAPGIPFAFNPLYFPLAFDPIIG
jgi:hypothetical protein